MCASQWAGTRGVYCIRKMESASGPVESEVFTEPGLIPDRFGTVLRSTKSPMPACEDAESPACEQKCRKETITSFSWDGAVGLSSTDRPSWALA